MIAPDRLCKQVLRASSVRYPRCGCRTHRSDSASTVDHRGCPRRSRACQGAAAAHSAVVLTETSTKRVPCLSLRTALGRPVGLTDRSRSAIARHWTEKAGTESVRDADRACGGCPPSIQNHMLRQQMSRLSSRFRCGMRNPGRAHLYNQRSTAAALRYVVEPSRRPSSLRRANVACLNAVGGCGGGIRYRALHSRSFGHRRRPSKLAHRAHVLDDPTMSALQCRAGFGVDTVRLQVLRLALSQMALPMVVHFFDVKLWAPDVLPPSTLGWSPGRAKRWSSMGSIAAPFAADTSPGDGTDVTPFICS